MTAGAGYEVGPVLAPGEPAWPADWEHSIVCTVCAHPRWESVLVPPYEEQMLAEVVRCVTCHAPRCGGAREADPCTKVLNHGGYHWMLTHHFEKPVETAEVS